MLVNGGQGCEFQPLREFFVARAVAVFFDEIGDEIEDIFLSLGERHGIIMGEEKGKVKRFGGEVSSVGI